ncbi:MAG: bifunctional riboflavin kinase/FAD synthetase [Planctomycetia bacterium]|nr:bifunctional riboflavin kinase/FAD synthetase [Planctomycetia bacterium]
MKLLRDLSELTPDLRGGAVTVGNFDGVHRGHARIVERLVAEARSLGGPAVVFTFDPHPVRILRPDRSPPPLTWTDRKAELLAGLGVDAVVAYPTDEALLRLTAREFFDEILLRQLQAKSLVEGVNFFFGHDRQGNIERLREFSREAGVALHVVPALVIDGEVVSSSRVRRLVASGDVAAAARLLTHPYRIRGMVTHGAGRGVKLGFPTANVDAVDTLLPAAGVYAGIGHGQGGQWPAAINLGPNPTFGESALKVEAHLVGFSGQLHGQPLELDFLKRLREVRTFPSVEALKEQLARDVADANEAARRIP